MKKRYIVTNIVICLVLVSLSLLSFGYTQLSPAFNVDNDKPIYKGNTLNNEVALMINVYWGTEYLTDMLKVFESYGIKTTFFFGGSWVDDNNELLKDIYNRGHEIANHGYFHKDHKKLNSEKNREEIVMCESIIDKILGVKTKLFAPPSGAFSDNTLKICKELGYKVIMWSKDTIDWRDKNTDLIFKRATEKVGSGDLILMHPTKCTLEALPKILEYYKNNNLKATTVSSVIADI